MPPQNKPSSASLAALPDKLRQPAPSTLALILGVFLLCLALTFSVHQLAQYYAFKDQSRHFSHLASDAADSMLQDLREQQLALQAASGFIREHGFPQRDEWQQFTASLNLHQSLPHTQGLGFAPFVSIEDLSTHESSVQDSGYPDYAVYPQGNRSRYLPVLYMEPFDWRNLRAFGFDMYSDPSRRAAINRAIEGNQVSLTGRLTLIQETLENVQHGLLMYAPVTQADPAGGTISSQESVLGVVFSAIRTGDFLGGLESEFRNELAMAIYQVKNNERLLMARSEGEDVFWSQRRRNASLSATRLVEFGGQTLALEVLPKAAFFAQFKTDKTTSIFVIGATLSILILILLLLLFRQRRALVDHLKSSIDSHITLCNSLNGVLTTLEQGLILSDEENRILWANQAAESLFGFDPESLAGRTLSELFPDKAMQEPGGHTSLFNSQGYAIPGEPREVQAVKQNLMPFPVNVTVKEVRHSDNNQWLFLVEAIKPERREEQMKRDLVGVVSHRLRTPATAIRGGVSLVLSGAAGGLTETQSRMLSIANSNVDRLVGLIDELIDLDRLDKNQLPIEIRSLNLAQQVDKALLLNRERINRSHCDIFWQKDGRPAFVMADEKRLSQVLTHLIHNALKYSPEKSQISIRLNHSPECLRLEITNPGELVPLNERELIFEQFVQIDRTDARQSGGNGLGLYICRELLKRMNAEIIYFVTAERHNGFAVLLPYSSD